MPRHTASRNSNKRHILSKTLRSNNKKSPSNIQQVDRRSHRVAAMSQGDQRRRQTPPAAAAVNRAHTRPLCQGNIVLPATVPIRLLILGRLVPTALLKTKRQSSARSVRGPP